jgi:hypothetical protein
MLMVGLVFNAVRNMLSRVGRPFRKAFTSPEGEGFPPSPKETLKYEIDLLYLLARYEEKKAKVKPKHPSYKW